MAQVFSKQLYLGHHFTDGSFVVEDGFIAVIRCIFCYAPGLVLGQSLLLVDHDSETTLFYGSADILDGGATLFVPDCRIVINPGKVVDITLLTLGDLALHGYLLSLP